MTRALGMLAAGAAIVDIGGMTARPGIALAADEEVGRVVPRCGRCATAAARRRDLGGHLPRGRGRGGRLDAGADLINDHTGWAIGDLAAAVAERGGGLVDHPPRAAPKQVQERRYEIDAGRDRRFLHERAAARRGRRRAAADAIAGRSRARVREDHRDRPRDCLRRLPELLALGRTRAAGLLAQGGDRRAAGAARGQPLRARRRWSRWPPHLGVHVLRVHDLPFMERVARMGMAGQRRSRGNDRRTALSRRYSAGGVRSGANSGRNRPSR